MLLIVLLFWLVKAQVSRWRAVIFSPESCSVRTSTTMAFRAYERRFRDFIERKQQSAEQFATSFTPKTRVGLFVRDLVLRLTAFSLVEDLLMRRFVTDQFKLPDYPA